VEPRLREVEVDGDVSDIPTHGRAGPNERAGLLWGGLAFLGMLALTVRSWPMDSPCARPTGSSRPPTAPLMQAIVPLIFLSS
jgi:aminobenzoyl-glutamate transport protein